MEKNHVSEHLLGIKKMPHVAGRLSAGRVYAVMLDGCSGLEWVCETVVGACALAQVEWIAETPSAYLGLSSALKQVVADYLRDGSLRIFQAETGKGGERCRSMLDELDFLGVARGSLVVVEEAGRFIEHAGTSTWEEDVAAWQHWAERTGCAVLWICHRREGQRAHEAELLRAAHRFSGLVRLRMSDDEMRWDIYYWFANEGLMADKSLRLRKGENGNWQVDERDTLNSGSDEHALDEDDVFAMRAALPGEQAAPDGWRVFETMEQMNAALASARAPTVIFHYNVGSSLAEFSRYIFELRRSTGSSIKIVVKVAGGLLRHSHEHLLLNMGANLTVSSEIGFSRMLNLVKSIQGQVYARAVPTSFEEGMAGLIAVVQTGYQPPADFAGAVSDVLEHARVLGVDSALIRLSLTRGLNMLEALRCCVMKRPGDFCTADDCNIYVFLFACEEHDVSATLDRLFRLPVSVLFSEETRFLSTGDIASALAGFEQYIREANCHSYTAALAESVLTDTTLQSGAVKMASTRKAVRAPYTAVPHALKLHAASA